MNGKQRLSASVDADLIEAAADAVARGRSGSVSAWVNEALRARLDRDRRLDALDMFVTAYERERGEITAEEMEQAVRRARSRATPVRGARTGTGSSARKSRRAR
jgi:Arc/MetJ-type ribon-helix-helix transcriptional regulator